LLVIPSNRTNVGRLPGCLPCSSARGRSVLPARPEDNFSQLEMCAPSWSPWYTRLSDLRGWLFMTSLCPGAAKVVSSQPSRTRSDRHAPRVNQRLTMCGAKSRRGCRRCTMNCITSCRTQTAKEPRRGIAGVRGTPLARMRATNLLYVEQQGCTDVASTFWVAGVRRGTGRLVVSVRRC
jgi:hypothetical protein